MWCVCVSADDQRIPWAGSIQDISCEGNILTVALKLKGTLRGRRPQTNDSHDIAVYTYCKHDLEGHVPALIYKRPYVDRFLQKVSGAHTLKHSAAHCRFIIYTSGLGGYADGVCKALDMHERHFKSRKDWILQHAKDRDNKTKQLSQVSAVAAATIIIDDNPSDQHASSAVWNTPADARQAIYIEPYHGPFSSSAGCLRGIFRKILDLFVLVSSVPLQALSQTASRLCRLNVALTQLKIICQAMQIFITDTRCFLF